MSEEPDAGDTAHDGRTDHFNDPVEPGERVERSSDGSAIVREHNDRSTTFAIDPESETGAKMLRVAQQEGKEPGQLINEAVENRLDETDHDTPDIEGEGIAPDEFVDLEDTARLFHNVENVDLLTDMATGVNGAPEIDLEPSRAYPVLVPIGYGQARRVRDLIEANDLDAERVFDDLVAYGLRHWEDALDLKDRS